MLILKEIDTEDGFYETTYDEFIGTDLNDLNGELIIDIVDDKFPSTRFSKDLQYLFVQLAHTIQIDGHIADVDLEGCTSAIRDFVFSLRVEGYFVFDNEVSIDNNHLSINWSFQRKFPANTKSLLAEIREIHPKVTCKATEIVQAYQNQSNPHKKP